MGGTAYVGSCAGRVYAFDIANGDTVWTFDVSGDGASQFHGHPIIDDSTIVIGTDMGSERRGTLYALNRADGTLRWKRGADPGLPSDLVAESDRIYTMSLADELIAFDRGTGAAAWRYTPIEPYDPEHPRETGGVFPRLKSNPLVYGDVVVVVERDNVVTAIAARTGELRWSYRHDSDITTQMCMTGDGIVFGTDAMEMITLDAADGSPIAMHPLAHVPFGTMSHSDPLLVYLAGDAGDTNARPRHVVALDLATGDVAWDREIEDPDPTAYWYVPRVHLWGTSVILGSNFGLLAAYDVELGEPVWTHQLEGAIRGIGHTGDLLLVGTFDGMLYALKFPGH